MRISRRLSSVSALALVFATQSAFADVTAQDVWADWRGYMEGMGYSISANEAMAGNVLTVSDLKMSFDVPDDAIAVAMEMDSISFSENGDGTVSVELPDLMPIMVTSETADGSPVNVQIEYSQTDFVMIVSGDPNDLTYDYSAASAAIALASLNIAGTEVSPDDISFDLSMTDIAGTSTMKTGDDREYSQKATVGALSYDVNITDPADSARSSFKGTLSNLKTDGSGTLPLAIDSSDVTAMLASGFQFAGKFEYQNGNSEFQTRNPVNGNVSGTSSSAGGTLNVAMDQSSLTYGGTARDMAMNISGDQIPFELSAKMEESLFNLTMPLGKSDQDQDFGLAISMVDFTMDDSLWNMFDPSGALPRDPATISFDLAGKAKLLIDFFDPEQTAMIAETDASPVELTSLDFNSLLISAAGAALSGTGAFTFDNTQDFNGMPKPTGAIDLKLVGGNGLLDRLVQMGMLPEEQAMGTRMMMGLFAVPGEGEDTLNSKIEINEEGHVLANGQRIQ